MGKTLSYAFWLILILVCLAYFGGFSKDVGSLSDAINKIINTLQGKNSNGNFSDYPGNAPK